MHGLGVWSLSAHRVPSYYLPALLLPVPCILTLSLLSLWPGVLYLMSTRSMAEQHTFSTPSIFLLMDALQQASCF